MTAQPSDRPRLLIACVGNIFLGDDAFGVEVAKRLLRRALPEGVRLVDFGIRGLDLAYALLEGYEAVILVDASPRGGAPGTLYVLEPEVNAPTDGVPLMETHNIHPARVLQLVAGLGGTIQRLLVVGCEPATHGEDDFAADMSAPVRAAVEEAVPLLESLLGPLLRGEAIPTSIAKETSSCPP